MEYIPFKQISKLLFRDDVDDDTWALTRGEKNAPNRENKNIKKR